MKHPKGLTIEQKRALEAAGLNTKNWVPQEETEFYLKVVNKTTGTRRTIDRYAIPKKGARK